MKKSIFFVKLCTLFSLLIMVACEGIFVPDPLDPRLPRYTENGNNVAGAYINDEAWNSTVSVGFMHSSDKPQLVATPAKDSLWICFIGSIDTEPGYIGVHLTGLKINGLEDLLNLSGKKIQLNGAQNAGYYRKDYDYDSGLIKNGGTGQIYFKNVRWGESGTFVILSGTFGFVYKTENGTNIKVSSGRFDYRISENDELYVEQQ